MVTAKAIAVVPMVEPVKNKKQNVSSDDDDDASYHTDDSDTEMDVHEYRKFLKNLLQNNIILY